MDWHDRTALSTLFLEHPPLLAEALWTARARRPDVVEGTLWQVGSAVVLVDRGQAWTLGGDRIAVDPVQPVRLVHPLELPAGGDRIWADRLLERGHDPGFQTLRRRWSGQTLDPVSDYRVRRRPRIVALIARGWRWISPTAVDLRIGRSRIELEAFDRVEGRWRLELRRIAGTWTAIQTSEILLDVWNAGGDVR